MRFPEAPLPRSLKGSSDTKMSWWEILSFCSDKDSLMVVYIISVKVCLGLSEVYHL